MASRQLFGSAQIVWTPPDAAEETFLLGAKLIELDPLDVIETEIWTSIDRLHREIVTVGDGVHELLGTIRFDDEPDELKRLLRVALRNDLTLEYEPVGGGTYYPVKLVAVNGTSDASKVRVRPDRKRWRLGEYEARVHLRRIDGETLDGLL